MEEINDKELTREERLEIEEQAIQALLQYGVKFSVPLKIVPTKPPKRILWWNKHFPERIKIWRDRGIPKDWNVELTEIADVNLGKVNPVYMRNFQIKPLFLGTIDAIRRLFLEIEYNEEDIQDDPVETSKSLLKYAPVMAEIAAVAVINSGVVTNPLDRKTKVLKQFFMEHLTVARLQKLTQVISQMMNQAGFTSSIRLIQRVGTTQPRANRVE